MSQTAAVSSTPVKRQGSVSRRFRSGVTGVLWALAGVALVVIMWELVKFVGTIVELPFNTNDTSMPHVWTMVAGFTEPEVRGSETTVAQAVAAAAFYSLLVALGGFVIGVGVGLILAVVMQRFAFMERGLLPFVIASYLAFFPMSVGALRGLQAPTATSLELMRSYAATPRQMLWKLRFPSSLPYLIPAMKVSAAAAVVGTVVAEISTGVRGGIGRLIIEYARETTSQPAKVYVAVFGAILLGLVAAALVTALDVFLTRNLPKENNA